ncbi:MAG: PQQ-dependent sugar dehydrogenase [Gammaproteobacteria bacterium]|nr:PQQ-dependent sugar dehydrogenase [Gammaproteobacteria bacterium]NNJ50219.1 PQQ-dependent sugar dehydrogenase [Gammaproteobacteria bacterium]
MKPVTLLLCLLTLLPLAIHADSPRIIQSEKATFALEQVIDGLGIPWGLAFISDSQLLITEREGSVKLLDLQSKALSPVQGAPEVMAENQAGLLDVAVPPGFTSGDWIYFTYVRDRDDQGVTVLARAKLMSNTAGSNELVQWQDLLETRSASDSGRHFGSRIVFDENGYVYFGVGDRGERPNSQDLTNHAGSVMRLHRDGRVPKDNPFLQRKDVQPEIWSYGHRNPQGMAYDYDNKRLWLIEHGPRGGDEINLVLPGRNYGWPVISYGKEYWGPLDVGEGTHRAGMEQPIKQYTPSIAPGSLLLYTANSFPQWRGNLFSGALKLQHLNRVTLSGDGKAIAEERLLTELDERIRALAQGPQGWLYFSTDSGKVYVMKPAARQ